MPLTTSAEDTAGPVIDSATLLPDTPLGIGDSALLTVIAHNVTEATSEATVTITVEADGKTGTKTVTVPLHDIVTGGPMTYTAVSTDGELKVTATPEPGVFRVERLA